MPLDTQTYTFDEEIARLEAERDDLAEQLVDLDPENPLVPQLSQRGTTIDSYLEGLRWARSTWDVDGVTLAGLTGGEFGFVEDELVSDTNGSPGNGATRVYLVAKGTVEAPYYDPEETFKQQIAAVSPLPIGFLKWAEARVDELTSVDEGNSKSFGELVEAKRQASTEE